MQKDYFFATTFITFHTKIKLCLVLRVFLMFLNKIRRYYC